MRTDQHWETARHISAVILLALTPLLVFGGLETHLGHRPGEAEAPIFAEASHAGQANHWEAVNPDRGSRCPDCVAPTQPTELAPETITRYSGRDSDSAPPGNAGGPPLSGAGLARRSRAPPSS